MARKTSVVGAIALIALTVIVAAGAMSAGAARNDLGHSSAHALVGSWDVTLTLPGLPPGRVLATFDGDGGTVESANAAPALRGASHGAWERIEPTCSRSRDVLQVQPAAGAYVGTQQVNATVRVARTAKRSPQFRLRASRPCRKPDPWRPAGNRHRNHGSRAIRRRRADRPVSLWNGPQPLEPFLMRSKRRLRRREGDAPQRLRRPPFVHLAPQRTGGTIIPARHLVLPFPGLRR